MKLYIIVMIIPTDEGFSMEPVGAFSTLAKATNCVLELDSYTEDGEDGEPLYEILEYDVDAEPPLLDFLKKESKIRLDEIEKNIIQMMKDGLVDQLIGEDGNFYYTLTELGKKTTQGRVVDGFNKFFKKE